MVHVLVVDDDKDFLRIVKAVLEHGGYTVTTSEDAMDAIEKFNTADYDLILSDANMPYRSGFDLIKTIRSSYKNPDVAMALLTARRDKKDVVKGLECGADDYIVKPIDPDLFLSKVGSLLKKRPPQDKGVINFAESRVDIVAQCELGLNISFMSEKGVTLTGAIAFPPNFKMKIKSDVFDKIGIQAPLARVLTSEINLDEKNQFVTQTAFVGLTDGELQKIRAWVNQSTQRKDRKAS